MLHDMSKVGNRVKPKADATLRGMKKDQLIEYIRDLEYNYNVAVAFNEQQAQNFQIIEDAIIEKIKEAGVMVLPESYPHTHLRAYKAVNVEKAIEIIKKGAVYAVDRISHGK